VGRYSQQIVITLALLTGTVACYQPPPPVAPRPVVPIAASFDHTWNAVIDIFADNSIPIQSMERASGFIVSREMSPIPDDSWADCGSGGINTVRLRAASFNVVVRGDSTSSSVRITTRFVGTVQFADNVRTTECSSNGIWERALEKKVKSKAEGRP
jgi:hypothetical protein